ncbi:hypothetical protein BT63DRAFT_424635 [Microthyrium microscopicum]|uniref:Integral membrane protein, Mpv17/PMP22 family n=1 Tax=Microthyrium microscopicum TaxID=703497 RepID=A0A6A6UDB6_9PEZI|nr:hypothetical protein BT63DRAFT_424635 [Microthyrium microscopicum]
MALLDTILQSTVLSVVSNILAQMIAAYQAKTDLFAFDITPITHFIIYTIINVPINVIWQDLLESTFPSSIVEPPTVEKKGDKKVEVKVKTGKGGLNITNTLAKFALDQTVGAAVNIPLFLAVIGLCKGQSVADIVGTVKEDFMPIYLAGAKLWPAVSLISFAAVPVERRVIFGSVAGVAWNIYLSLKASG